MKSCRVNYVSATDYANKYHGNRSAFVRVNLRAKILREKLIDYVCRLCGITEWRGHPLTLRLDHIDGDGRNHQLNNLRFLCPNCDSQLPTYGHKNRGRYKADVAQR